MFVWLHEKEYSSVEKSDREVNKVLSELNLSSFSYSQIKRIQVSQVQIASFNL